MLLDDYPELFTVVEIDVTGNYSPDWGYTVRDNFYNVTGTPTTWFDGLAKRVGAYSDVQSQYDWYEQTLLSRAEIPSDVTIEMNAAQTDAHTYEVTSTVSLELGGAAKTMRFYLVETLDHYPALGTYYRNGLRQAVEDGVDITLLPGQSQVMTRSVTLDGTSSNQFEDITMIAWTQAPRSNGPAEVFNAAQLPLFESEPLPGDFDRSRSVDGADLALWQAGYGLLEAAGHADGDADGDRDVDGADFLIWQRQATTHEASSFLATVPEPATWLLLAAAVCFSLKWMRSGAGQNSW